MNDPSALGEHGDLVKRLLRAAGTDVEDLPYTEAFELLYAEFIRQTGLGVDKHNVWRQIVELRDVAGPATEKLAPVAMPQVPVKAEAPVSSTATLTAKSSSRTEGQLLLFSPSVEAEQPWRSPPPRPPDDAKRQERERLLASLGQSRLATVEQKVAHILQRYPETRDSDTALAIRYWTIFQSDVLERWDQLNLEVMYDLMRLDTISRSRRHIQNELRLFTALPFTRQQRGLMQMEFYEYLVAHRPTAPDIRFFLDETGNEGQKAYLGVAGVCVMNWRQYEKHWASLTQWRSTQGWPETIHFADTDAVTRDRAASLLSALRQRQSGLLFIGYALPSRGKTRLDLLYLFVQLVIDSLRHMNNIGCMGEARAIKVIKEADAGFDAQYLKSMDRDLAVLVAQEFPGRLVVEPTEAIPKGREVMLECTDLIAGGMQRRALYGGRNPKDVLAEAVFNVTGFEDVRDNGTVFKAYPA